MQVTAILTPAEEGGYVALNPETGAASQGETVEEALANLREAVELYLEEFPMNFAATPLVTTFNVLEHAQTAGSLGRDVGLVSNDPVVPDAIKAEIDEGQRLRGWITNSYAQIEYALGDLIVRCRAFSEYDNYTKTITHSATQRIAKVRNILTEAGPLDPFKESLTIILDRFEKGHETRNLLVHGFCTYLRTPSGDTALQFEKWHRQPSQDDASRQDDVRLMRQFRFSTMRNEMESFVELAYDAVRLLREIHLHFGWEGRHST